MKTKTWKTTDSENTSSGYLNKSREFYTLASKFEENKDEKEEDKDIKNYR